MTRKRKIIAMVPVRYGSTRVKKKNLRLIDGRPLVSYVLEALSKTTIFDEVYLNSEHEIFEEIAHEYGAKFYKREARLASNTATNDEFAYDFMKNTDGDILIQVLATSPLVTPEEIEDFVSEMIKDEKDILISVERNQISNFYQGKPLNFNRLEKNPLSQNMEPVFTYASVMMGWTYKSFIENMEKFGCAYHGGDKEFHLYEVNSLATIDIDREEDFQLAEALLVSRKHKKPVKIEYYGESE
ncbi:hypothetical protein BIY24_14670 [Halobacteriovorax marinus]|uniref:acylneuraminate cytidylyltransferase family protein n=1 Tax=Halobacteriovorax marinus TaxID=97084 RepID=UPI000BC31C74|nr:NTP transferase domain-containing protein [Halobacteriovorax marinus]ATH09140.1 hypothetical protein BIY24_14670 [Halobacteriovorax marinus]